MGCVHEIGLAGVCGKCCLYNALCWISVLCLKYGAFTAAVMDAFGRDVIIRQASAFFVDFSENSVSVKAVCWPI